MYGALLNAGAIPTAVLTLRNALLVVLLAWAIVRLARVPRRVPALLPAAIPLA